MKKIIVFLSTSLLLSACAQNYNTGRTSLYRDISGQHRGDGALAMSEAYCRNMVNSYAPPYEGPSGPYATSNTGRSLNRAISSVGRSMSGPNYNDCMLSQGFQLAGYE
jgi:hypothetical protein